MKKLFFVLLFTGTLTAGFAQDEKEEEKKGGFKKENLFTGGGIQLSFSNYTTVIGASPVLGYSINKWIDAGIGFNFNYASNRHAVAVDPFGNYYYTDDKIKQTILGPGVFARVYPIKFLFIQVLGEYNFINQKVIYDNGYPTERYSVSAPSCLVGAGYCNGREGKGSLFYYISIMADVVKDRNSPYVEETASGKVNMLPIIRAGLQVPLFQGKRHR